MSRLAVPTTSSRVLLVTVLTEARGRVMTLMGTVQNFAGLVAVRFFLGLFEYVLFSPSRSLNLSMHVPH